MLAFQESRGMPELVIVFSEECLGSQRLREVVDTLDWQALGIAVSWLPFDHRDPRVRAAGVFATPTGILNGRIVFAGSPDQLTLLRQLEAARNMAG
jgi:hypothetical protein